MNEHIDQYIIDKTHKYIILIFYST